MKYKLIYIIKKIIKKIIIVYKQIKIPATDNWFKFVHSFIFSLW